MKTLFNPHTVADLLWEAPFRVGKSLKQVAEESGLGYKHLSRMLNPHDDGAKLGWEEMVYILAVTDLEPLDAIERAFGRVVMTIPDDTILDEATLVKLAGEALTSLGEALAQVEPQAGGDLVHPKHNLVHAVSRIDRAISVLGVLRAKVAGSPLN